LLAPYFLIIKPTGENNINAVLSEIKTINQTDKKLERLAEWEAEDFTETFAKEPNLFLFGILGGYGLYFNISNSQPIKIRPISIIFSHDPYWISYFKTGACLERAYLFNFIANQSGEVTRVVSSPGNDHVWVEVYNGTEWNYADPTFYYYYHNSPGREKAWLNETPMLQSAWGWQLSKVTIASDETELTKNYTDVGNLTIIFNSSNQVTVSQFIAGEHRNVSLFSKHLKESPRKEMVIYQLGLSNNYTVTAEKNNYYLLSKRIDEKIVFLDNESTTVNLNPETGREEIDYLSIVFWTVIVVVYGIILYQFYKKMRERK